MGKHIIGVFNSEEEAIRVINQLKAEGYRADDISVIGRNNEGLSHIENETETKAEEGLATGAGAGGLAGGLIGLGIPENEAKDYDNYVKDGKILVLVESDSTRDPKAYETFRNNKSLNANTYTPEYGYRS